MPVALPASRHGGQFASYLYSDEYRGRCRAYDEDPEQVLRTLWWGNVSMRRADAISVGLVSPGLESVYHEDQDFGLRCLESGLRGVFDRSLSARHLHERDIDAFIRDARSQGAGQVIVHQRHADLIGEIDPLDFAAGLPKPAALLVRSAGHPVAARASSAILREIVKGAGRLGWFRIETNAGRLLRRVNQRSGAESVWQHTVPTGRVTTLVADRRKTGTR